MKFEILTDDSELKWLKQRSKPKVVKQLLKPCTLGEDMEDDVVRSNEKPKFEFVKALDVPIASLHVDASKRRPYAVAIVFEKKWKLLLVTTAINDEEGSIIDCETDLSIYILSLLRLVKTSGDAEKMYDFPKNCQMSYKFIDFSLACKPSQKLEREYNENFVNVLSSALRNLKIMVVEQQEGIGENTLRANTQVVAEFKKAVKVAQKKELVMVTPPKPPLSKAVVKLAKKLKPIGEAKEGKKHKNIPDTDGNLAELEADEIERNKEDRMFRRDSETDSPNSSDSEEDEDEKMARKYKASKKKKAALQQAKSVNDRMKPIGGDSDSEPEPTVKKKRLADTRSNKSSDDEDDEDEDDDDEDEDDEDDEDDDEDDEDDDDDDDEDDEDDDDDDDDDEEDDDEDDEDESPRKRKLDRRPVKQARKIESSDDESDDDEEEENEKPKILKQPRKRAKTEPQKQREKIEALTKEALELISSSAVEKEKSDVMEAIAVYSSGGVRGLEYKAFHSLLDLVKKLATDKSAASSLSDEVKFVFGRMQVTDAVMASHESALAVMKKLVGATKNAAEQAESALKTLNCESLAMAAEAEAH